MHAMPSRETSSNASKAAQPGVLRRPSVPIGMVVLEAIALGGLQYAETSELLSPANAFLAKVSIVGLATILLFAWFVLLAPMSSVVRRWIAVVGLSFVVALVAMVRVEGVSGDVIPKLRFRWMRHADEDLPAAAGAAADATVDLSATTPDDSPQFLGRDRLATWSDPRLVRDWSAHPPRLVWRQPIGAGWSSYAVVGHYGVTQEQRGEDELVTCYDLDDGKLLWSHATPVRFYETLAGVGPRATPTIDGGRVYSMGALGHLACLDGATGKPLWQHDLLKENHALRPQWGKSCSPLVYDNLVIASAGGSNGRSLIAFDKQSGSEVWHAGDDFSSYSSPTVFTLDGVQQIVMVNSTTVTGHDPASGHILWQHAWPEEGRASPNVSQPIALGGDRVLLTKGYGIGSASWHIKHEGDAWTVEDLWRNNYLKTKFTSAVVRDGYAYGLDEGVLSCIDVDSGTRRWKKGKYGHGQVLLVGELLLVQSETGELALVEAQSDAFRELTRFVAVGGQTWNYPTLAGRRLLVRSEQEAACYELPME
jgi:outer membrane protein assembly factor BamB